MICGAKFDLEMDDVLPRFNRIVHRFIETYRPARPLYD